MRKPDWKLIYHGVERELSLTGSSYVPEEWECVWKDLQEQGCDVQPFYIPSCESKYKKITYSGKTALRAALEG